MPDFIDNVEEDIAEVLDYQPKPGGLIDRHRKERARREEAQQQQENIDAGIEQPSYKAVKVAPQSPELMATNVVTIAADSVALILPANPYRYSAMIMVNTANGEVIIGKDANAALGNGFPIFQFAPFSVPGRSQVWGANPLGTAVQVTTIAFIYAPENR